MKLLLPFGLIAAMWGFCGLGDKKVSEPAEKPAANVTRQPVLDRDAVKKELVSLANQIGTAAKDGDITFLAQITTDDFKLTDVSGKVSNKNKALADIKEEKNIRDFEIFDENLVSLDESSAVLSYTIKVIGKNGRSVKAATTDTFVRENGKWKLKSEQATLLRR
ncbi:MAG: nuclear transport factor 2 family protein [Pyrinomonadaceae bacterium]